MQAHLHTHWREEMSFKKFLISFLFFYTTFAWADQLIIEPDMGRAPIINAIKDTRYSIDLVIYGFTDQQILKALLKHGSKSLKIILEQTPYRANDENLKTIHALNDMDVKWHGSVPPFRLIHQKTLLLDDRKAIVMTFNFTQSTFKNQRNFALVIDDPKRVKAIQAIFDADWNHKSIQTNCSDLIVSPDHSREKLIDLIKQAKQSIQIYAQTLNDYKIVGTIAKAAHKGIKVEVLTSASMRSKQFEYLARAGVSIHQSRGLYIHAKVMIIDNKLAIIGSTNLTRPSFEDNRELSVVTYDNNVIRQLNNTFKSDWQDATPSIPQKQNVMHTLNKILKCANKIVKVLS